MNAESAGNTVIAVIAESGDNESPAHNNRFAVLSPTGTPGALTLLINAGNRCRSSDGSLTSIPALLAFPALPAFSALPAFTALLVL